MRIAILARVSTEEQARGQSIDNQVAICSEHAKRQGWQIADVIREEGDSGKRVLARRGILQLLDLVDTHRINAVLAYEQDRYHRNEYEFETLLRDYLWPAKIKVFTLQGELNDDSTWSWNARKSNALYAEQHSRITSEKVRRANDRRRAQGQLISGRPFGTMKNPDGKGRVRDPVTWPVLIEIFERVATGESFNSIARDLHRREVPTVEGGKWWGATVSLIIRCRYYIGETTHRGRVVTGPDGHPIQVEHDCLIRRDLWESCQQHRQAGRNSGHVYLLQGLVVCSHYRYTGPIKRHGGPVLYAGHLNRQRTPTYMRTDPSRPHMAYELLDDVNMPGELDAALLEQLVIEHVIRVADNNDLLTKSYSLAQEKHDQAARDIHGLAETLGLARRRLATAERTLGQLLDTGLDEALRLQNQKVADLRVAVDDAEASLATARRTANSLPRQVVDVERINLVADMWRNNELRALKRLLSTVIERVDVRISSINIEYIPILGLDQPDCIINSQARTDYDYVILREKLDVPAADLKRRGNQVIRS